MNTIAATRSGGLREFIGDLGLRIERLGQRMSAWGAVRKSTYPKTKEEFDALIAALPTSDLELKPEVKRELLAQLEDAKQGKNMSPRFKTVEEAAEWLES